MKTIKDIENFIHKKLARWIGHDHPNWKREWKKYATKWLQKTHIRKINDYTLSGENKSNNKFVKIVSLDENFYLYHYNTGDDSFDKLEKDLPINLWIDMIVQIFDFAEEKFLNSNLTMPSLNESSVYCFYHRNYWHQILANYLGVNIGKTCYKDDDDKDVIDNEGIDSCSWRYINYKNLILKSNLDRFNDEMKKNVALDIFYNLAAKHCCKEETKKIRNFPQENIFIVFEYQEFEVRFLEEKTVGIINPENAVHRKYYIKSQNENENDKSLEKNNFIKLFLMMVFELYSLFNITTEKEEEKNPDLSTFVETKTSLGRICQVLDFANSLLLPILGKDIVNIVNDYTRIDNHENFKYHIL
jgi:hypothetical protein